MGIITSSLESYLARGRQKLVLVDIFTYSCMNCLRSLHFLGKLAKKYRHKGLGFVILHPFEFSFEKDKKRVSEAIKELGIRYPVILDRDRKQLRSLGLHFWPSQLLFSLGKLAYSHVKEGNYPALEGEIQKHLNINEKKIFCGDPFHSAFAPIYGGSRKGGDIGSISAKKKKQGIIYADGNWKQANEYLYNTKKKAALSFIADGTVISMVASSRTGAKVALVMGDRKAARHITHPKMYQLMKRASKKQAEAMLATDAKIKLYSLTFE